LRKEGQKDAVILLRETEEERKRGNKRLDKILRWDTGFIKLELWR
jgi:hypothetical protein